MIFVFGSNLLGIHGKGAALVAKKQYGAVQGIAFGLCGNSFAIPTKETPYKSLPLDSIYSFVRVFLEYAKDHPEDTFYLTPIGCGLAGYSPVDIAPMFSNATTNIILPEQFKKVL